MNACRGGPSWSSALREPVRWLQTVKPPIIRPLMKMKAKNPTAHPVEESPASPDLADRDRSCDVLRSFTSPPGNAQHGDKPWCSETEDGKPHSGDLSNATWA